MNLHIKSFSQLSTRELFEILKLRCAVFVVEQNCPYQDIDDIDLDALHVFYEENGEIVSYLRVFYPQGETDCARIGRVISAKRGIGMGAKVLTAGISAAKEQLVAKKIFIEAQTYAIGFYEKAGFSVCGEEFLEDGIPHVPMLLHFEK